jgi:hypothetical protein
MRFSEHSANRQFAAIRGCQPSPIAIKQDFSHQYAAGKVGFRAICIVDKKANCCD